MRFRLKIWRQKSAAAAGRFQEISAENVSPDSSFLEMLDGVNERLILAGGEPVAFDHDCREGICGSCGMAISGEPHGPQKAAAACQLYMREFPDGAEIFVEPFRAKAFPVLRDLIVDRSSLDRIQAAGGYISADTGSAPEAAAIPVPKESADQAFAAGMCIGCGACAASCKNSSASLFAAARAAQLAHLPQGQPEKSRRALSMAARMDLEGFGACSHTGSCEAACPKGISLENIALFNRLWRRAALGKRGARAGQAGRAGQGS